MSHPNIVLLYVNSPAASAEFYAKLLGQAPIQASANFAMFALDSGVMLGLWAMHDVEPASPITGGGGELGFSVSDRQAVLSRHEDWVRRGLTIAQAPTDMDFGYTFVALDPDRHRLRVFAPNMQ